MATEPIDIPIRETGARRTATSILGIGTAASSAAGSVINLLIRLGGFAALAGVVKFTANYQTEMLGVQKTTGLADKEIAGLSNSFREMTRALPNSASELANIGTVAGQLGIQNSQDILAFTDTIAKIASVTDFTTQAAAEDLARISNLFGLPIQQVGKLGAALNELENTTTANAPRIAEFTKRIAVAGNQLGLTVGDVAGLSATLVDLGFSAELAGTAISKTFTEMQIDAEGFGRQMGLSADEFRAALEQDAIGTVQKWAQAVGDLPNNQLIQQLKAVGIEGSRALQVFGALTKRGGLLAKNVTTANKAFEEGTSLQKEFDVQMKSVNNQFQLATNRVANIVLGIGQGLLPTVSSVIKSLVIWVDSLAITEFQLRNIGAFIAGVFLESLEVGKRAVLAVKIALDGLAASALTVTSKIGLLLIPFAKLTDLIGLTDNATEDVMANLFAMEGAAGELFTEAGKKVDELKGKVEATKIEVDTTFRTLNDLTGKATQGLGSGAQPAPAPKPQAVLPFTKDELEEFRGILEEAKTPADLLAEKIEEINFLMSRPGGLTEEQGQAAIIRAIKEANEQYIDSVEGLREVMDTSVDPQEQFAQKLERINKLFEDGEISANQASRAIQAYGESLNQPNTNTVELDKVLNDIRTPLDNLEDKLETVGRLFDEGVLDDEQASAAVKRYTDTYNDEMEKVEKKTVDANKGIKDAINGLANSMESRVTDLFTNMIKGTADFEEFFTGLIDEMIAQIIRLAVVRPIISGIFGGLGFAGGGSFEVPGFASGGGFNVGGSGTTDSKLVTFRATPGETVRVTTPEQERARMGDKGDTLVEINIAVHGDGSSTTESQGESSDFALQAGNIIKSVVLDMMRPDQPLGKALKGG